LSGTGSWLRLGKNEARATRNLTGAERLVKAMKGVVKEELNRCVRVRKRTQPDSKLAGECESHFELYERICPALAFLEDDGPAKPRE